MATSGFRQKKAQRDGWACDTFNFSLDNKKTPMSAIDLLSGKAKHFATHAFNKYSDEELNQLQKMGQPDQVELDTWEITADEWYSALQAAIADRLIGEENRL